MFVQLSWVLCWKSVLIIDLWKWLIFSLDTGSKLKHKIVSHSTVSTILRRILILDMEPNCLIWEKIVTIKYRKRAQTFAYSIRIFYSHHLYSNLYLFSWLSISCIWNRPFQKPSIYYWCKLLLKHFFFFVSFGSMFLQPMCEWRHM